MNRYAEFRDDDMGYERWIENNPHGYVLNTERNPKEQYLIVHHVKCGQLHRKDPRQRDKTHTYMKVCSPEIAGLRAWANDFFGRPTPLQPCGQCRPPV